MQPFLVKTTLHRQIRKNKDRCKGWFNRANLSEFYLVYLTKPGKASKRRKCVKISRAVDQGGFRYLYVTAKSKQLQQKLKD